MCEMKCTACGDVITEDCAGILREAGEKPEGPMCEGCAEDELDAIRSADEDAREMGFDDDEPYYPDHLDAYDPYDCEYDR